MSHQSELIKKDIDAYLVQHEKKELLRLLTCGSVDDGKSTLIGRLLYDSKLIYEDQLAAITTDSIKLGSAGGTVDLALLVDGLQAEREQGITIDVAYRYFSTTKRKFIIADTPGHEQYTRNMATGASTCDLVIILIDARNGAQTQTYRHSIIASLLGIRHGIIAINKMDLVGYSETAYNEIKRNYLSFATKLDYIDLQFVPISALHGDNMTDLSQNMRWYQGRPLMELLETTELAADHNLAEMRLPVQYVNRPGPNFRGYCGTLAAGTMRPGDAITVLPSGKTSTIKSILSDKKELTQAFSPMAITITLTDEIDISRGDMIVHSDHLPLTSNRLNANIIWMSEQAITAGPLYYFKFAGGRFVNGTVTKIHYQIDVNTLAHSVADTLHLNEIGYCNIALNTAVIFDSYRLCKETGCFIIIDRLTNATVGAGMIIGTEKQDQIDLVPVSSKERYARYGQYGLTVWLTSGDYLQKARMLERKLFNMGRLCILIEGDQTTNDINTILNQAGMICICSITGKTPPSTAQGVVFDCEHESVDYILEQIIEKTKLR